MVPVIAGTGHRPEKLGGYGVKVYENCFATALVHLDQTKPGLVISGMALGWDTALAEAAYCLGIPFDAYIPFTGQESKWPTKAQEFYRSLLKQARRVVNIGGDGYHPRKMLERDERMVDAVGMSEGHMLALWDGQPDGGTAHTVRYAESQGVAVVNLWEQFQHAKPFP